MNFKKEFESALSLQNYEDQLGDQKALYELHFKKAFIEQQLPEFDKLNILVITETWCSDSTAILPVIKKLLLNHNAEIKVALRDKNPGLMEQFLTKGKKSIPIVLVLDEDYELLMQCGPRPAVIQNIYEENRAEIEAGIMEKKDVTRKIRTFYAKDKGKVISGAFINQLQIAMQKFDIDLMQ